MIVLLAGGEPRSSYEAELRAELMALRQGPGLQRSPLRGRVGPWLTEICGASPADAEGVLRQRLRDTIAAWAGGMPVELRRAAELAFALDPHHRYLQLDRRLDQLARELCCQPRTARRRIDAAVDWLVRAAAAQPQADTTDSGQPWQLRSFQALLRLDTPTPELYEKRDLVAVRPIDEITVRFSLPRHPGRADADHDVFIDVLYGARIREIVRDHVGQCFELTLDLPTRLAPAQAHEILLHYRLPEHQPMREHYAFQPLTSCAECVLRVRFPLDRVPPAIWRMDGVQPRALDHPMPGAHRLAVDAVGELLLTFSRPKQGHAYGVAWSTPPPA